jgi:MraZ protein
MFQGNSKSSLDEKGRIIIPSKFRKHITSEANNIMYVTLGRDKCLWLFPSYEWIKLLKTLSKINPFKKDETMMKRQLLKPVEELTIDTQHRILIPQNLLQQVEIKKEVLLIGQLEKIELWDESVYNKYIESSPESYEDIMDKVMGNIPIDDTIRRPEMPE